MAAIWEIPGYRQRRPSRSRCRVLCCQLQHSIDSVHVQKEQEKYSCINQATSYLHVQYLRSFPTEKLCGEVVVVRLDSAVLLGACNFSLKRTLLTIKYLHKARAKVVIVTSWVTLLQSSNPVTKSIESFAEYLSSLLQLEVTPLNGPAGLTSFKQEECEQGNIILFENLLNFKGEIANCKDFSQKLASGAAIFVNDSFSLSHKILASTVGITCFCYASLAGFHFEEELMQLLKITDTTRRPYLAIIGGSRFSRKAPALHLLASLCDGLFFVGKLSFQIMNGLGLPVPSQLIEQNEAMEVLKLIQVAHKRNIPIYYPTDLWCSNNDDIEKLGIFNSTELCCGWTPADIGPSTVEKLSSVIPLYKKILWIDPTNYDLKKECLAGGTWLGQILENTRSDECEVILVGNAACKAVNGMSDSLSGYIEFHNASIVWEFLKGRILPGIAALDKCFALLARHAGWVGTSLSLFGNKVISAMDPCPMAATSISPLANEGVNGCEISAAAILDLALHNFLRLHVPQVIAASVGSKDSKFYPYQIPWNAVFSDPTMPLAVDIGSAENALNAGNGLFLFQMARTCRSSNFLGLEMNGKLVVRCLQGVASDDKKNLYFISTNATSTFRSIVSSYPGRLTLVTIQCPNPDFNKEQNRWRMVQRMLVEAVADLLEPNGKVYLQSDVESVLLGMKEQFITHGKGRLVVVHDDGGAHRMENPFGVASDWERHVLARGAPMYRTMLRKV
ncbi:hypothetical protein ACP4OV_027784 [Aristida adscensionis]